jgi:O-antigen/teichoic acid export membrane protein
VGSRVAFLLSLPLILFLIFGGNFILSLFGPEFSFGYTPMLIIIAGQIFNVASGSVGNILIMTGNEKYAFIGLLISCLVNIGLNILLVPHWAMIGTAIAVAASIITWNGVMIFFVRKKTKIYPTILGNF